MHLSHVIPRSCVHSLLAPVCRAFLVCPFEHCTTIPCPSRFRPGWRLICPMRCFVSSVAVRFFPQLVQVADPRLLQRRLVSKYVFACRYLLNLVTLQSHRAPINMSDAAELFILSDLPKIICLMTRNSSVSATQNNCLMKRNSSVSTSPQIVYICTPFSQVMWKCWYDNA